MDGIRKANFGPKTPPPAYYPHSSEKFAQTVKGDSGLARIAISGRPCRAAYLVVDNRLYFSVLGHVEIMSQLGEAALTKTPPSHYGWFRIMPRGAGRTKPAFVIDSFSDYNHGRLPEQRWELSSLDEYFAFFYVALLKSGVTDFSVRLTSGGKRAAAINEKNWRSESSLLFEDEKIEAEFIRQLALSLPPRP